MSRKNESIASQIRKRERQERKAAKREERQARKRGEVVQADPWVNRRGA